MWMQWPQICNALTHTDMSRTQAAAMFASLELVTAQLAILVPILAWPHDMQRPAANQWHACGVQEGVWRGPCLVLAQVPH
jgi:cyanate permease